MPVIFLLFTLPLIAQKNSVDTLKPGIVLSGGGAKGFAHIGVLEVLEQNGIYLEFLTGTSIGSIIGAYYVAGYSPQEILKKFREMNMDDFMQDQPPRRYLPLYIKKSGRDNFFYFPVNKKNLSIQLPRGLVNYQLFYNQLFKDLYNIQYLESFDSVPVKFRFIATDLVEGEQVIFSSGSVPRAVVASSAFPSIVTPVKIDGKLLSDGGILNNYPVEELYKLGANYSIGSDIQGRLLKEEEINSIPDILNQITGFYMYASMPDKKRRTSVYIRPKVQDFGVTDFEKIDTIYLLGYEETQKYLGILQKISPQNNKEKKTHKLKPYLPDSLYFKAIEIISKPYPSDQDQILWRANFSTGKKISFEDFQDGINYLYGSGNYKQIHYWIEPDSTLVMDILKDTVDLKFKLAYHYTPLYKINLLAGVVHKNFIKENGLLDLELILGDPFRYNFDILFDNGYHFGFGFRSSLHQFKRNVSYPLFFDTIPNPSFNRMDLNYSRFQNSFYFLTMLSTNFNLRLGGEINRYNIYTTVFSSSNNNLKYFLNRESYANAFFELYYDDMDDFYFPSHGVIIRFDLKNHFLLNRPGNKNFYELNFYISGSRRHSPVFSTSYQLRSGIVTHSSPPLPFQFFIGGIEHKNPVENLIPFYSRDYLSIKTFSYLLIQPQIQRKFGKYSYFQFGVQGLITEKGQRLEQIESLYNVYLRYGIKSFFGPVFVTYALEPLTKKSRLNFSVGFYF